MPLIFRLAYQQKGPEYQQPKDLATRQKRGMGTDVCSDGAEFGKLSRRACRERNRARRGFTLPVGLLLLALFFDLSVPTTVAAAHRPDPVGTTALEKFLTATKDQQTKLRDLSMEVDIRASLPRLGKKGSLHAFRSVTKLGAVTYRTLAFQGDNTVKKDVIARYLQAEKEAGDKPGLGITPDNYKFDYRGVYPWGTGKIHLFHLAPKRKEVGLFEGWLWVDDATGLPVREQGEFARNPSVFLKRVSFVRDYIHKDGIAIPVRIESTIDTRIVGKAEVEVQYSNINKHPREENLLTTATR